MIQSEILSKRIIQASAELVYAAFANPDHLKNWWGPEGFTNTIHEFDLKPGGNWILTMHGPEKGNYENASVFEKVIPNQLVTWKRKSKPLFDMEIAFEKLGEDKMQISFRMIFESKEDCDKMRNFVVPNNEENFDRLEREIKKLQAAL